MTNEEVLRIGEEIGQIMARVDRMFKASEKLRARAEELRSSVLQAQGISEITPVHKVSAKGALESEILAALKDGPKTARQVAAFLGKREHNYTGKILGVLVKKGMVTSTTGFIEDCNGRAQRAPVYSLSEEIPEGVVIEPLEKRNDKSRVEAISALHKSGKKQTEIAALYNMGERQIRRLEGVQSYPDIIKDALDDKKSGVTTTHATLLMKVATRFGDGFSVKTWIDTIREKRWSVKELQTALRQEEITKILTDGPLSTPTITKALGFKCPGHVGKVLNEMLETSRVARFGKGGSNGYTWALNKVYKGPRRVPGLGERDARLLKLCGTKGATVNELAERMGVSDSCIYFYMAKIKKHLRKEKRIVNINGKQTKVNHYYRAA